MRYLLLFLTLALGSLPAATPEEAVRAYAAKIKSDGLGSVAALMHPEELEQFQKTMTPVIKEALKDPEDRAVFAKFAVSATNPSLKPLGAQEFMATFLQCIDALAPELTAVIKNATFEVLGHVKEGATSHVVTRMRAKVEDTTVEEMTIISTRDYQGSARVMLSGDLKQAVEQLLKQ